MKKDNFLYVGSEFENKFKASLDSRYFTFKAALNLLHQHVKDEPIAMLETGCVRLEDDWGAGNSTMLFAHFLQNYSPVDSILTSVDIEPKNAALCRNLVNAHYPPELNRFHFSVIEDDSIHYLESCLEGGTKFDFIYLDSLDANLENVVIAKASQEHQLKEAKLAVQLYKAVPMILLLDDNNLPWGGKTNLTKQFLADEGWTCILDYQQSLWIAF